MNARDIEIFCEIMRSNSLSLAAKALNVSQPALSQALRHCEDRIGYALFRRRAGRLTPTAEATALWPEAERLFHELRSFRSLTRDLGGRQGGLLRLGTTSSLGVSLVPKAVAQLRREWPLARISVNLMPVRELGEALLARRLDVGLALTSVEVPGLEHVQLGTVPCIVLLPEDHPLAAQPGLGPAQLAGLPEIGFGGWQDFGRSLDLAFDAEGVERRIAIEIGSTVGAVAMVREGIGFAIVDGFARGVLPPGVVARPFLPRVERKVVLLRSRMLGNPEMVDRLSEIMRALCQADVPPD
ncbi:LysR family transcriptional regulator [Humitalea sp. 24SJ18S-53]|uniref:LysR family transcriptional regulator n=1 Tax=Humitalea sp. 24SJ18S-53 TaxID=3422307 RepID=UPI003D67B7E2